MTISSTTRVAGPFAGTGSTATFPFAFKVFDPTDLYVITLDVATGTMAVLTLTTDYTVALSEDQDSSPGGSITLTAGNLAAGYTLTITTAIGELQGLDLTNGGAFYPDVINSALDLLTVYVQQLAAQVSRSVQAPLVDSMPNVALPAAAQRAGKLLMFDAAGNLTLVAPGGGAVSQPQVAVGAVDGANKNFTVTALTAAAPTPLVYVAGVYQTPGTDYTFPLIDLGNGQWRIALTAAPAAGPVTVLLFS